MVPSFSGLLKTDLWLRAIPHAGEAHTWLREVIVALSALGIGRRRTIGICSSSLDCNSHTHELYALERYDKALRNVQLAIERSQIDVRQVLFICMLIFCFETLQGRQQMACQNAVDGLRAVARLRSGEPRIPWKTQVISMNLYSRTGLDDDMYIAEYSLEAQLAQFINIRSADEHEEQTMESESRQLRQSARAF